MSRYNLLDEPWIRVIEDNIGKVKEVSLRELFDKAHLYKRLAGESQMQNFAILRLLLAILHTVFSRFNHLGENYPYIALDEKMIPFDKVDEDYYQDYVDDLQNTLIGLWELGKIPPVVNAYLEKWRESFYLFDEKTPFYQITLEEMNKRPIKSGRGVNPTKIMPKTLNRTISESGNKVALFSPRQDEEKNALIEAELIRWLILYQGMVGTFDKASFREFDGTNSKGWIYDIGGVSMAGENLFETLILNLVLIHPNDIESESDMEEPESLDITASIEKPSWEVGESQIIDNLIYGNPIDNLAELYTNWSRGIFIDPEAKLDNKFVMSTVKLPEINHLNNFLETMTRWNFQTSGEYKDNYVPLKHKIEESFWRSFGSLFLGENIGGAGERRIKRPGLIEWFYMSQGFFPGANITFESYGMGSDMNATSWLPVDEYYDSLPLEHYLLLDTGEGGWVERINEEVYKIEHVIDRTLRKFANDINEIRNSASKGFTKEVVSLAFSEIDLPFRDWLLSLDKDDDKELSISKWRKTLKKIIINSADRLVESAGNREFKGIIDSKGNQKNIATIYNEFVFWLNNELN